jgi:hypothetical protein
VDEEDDSYESSTEEGESDSSVAEGSDDEANPYADGFSDALEGVTVDFGDDARSTITHNTTKSVRTERTAATNATAKSKKHKDVLSLFLVRLICRIKFIQLGMIFFRLRSS